MTLTPELVTRIEIELARGSYYEPSDLIAHALDLVDAESKAKERRAEIIAELQKSIGQAERGEGFDEAQLRARMQERRTAREAAV